MASAIAAPPRRPHRGTRRSFSAYRVPNQNLIRRKELQNPWSVAVRRATTGHQDRGERPPSTQDANVRSRRFSALSRGGVIPGASTPARTRKADSRELIHAPGYDDDARYDAEGYLRSIIPKTSQCACKQRMEKLHNRVKRATTELVKSTLGTIGRARTWEAS